MFCLQIQAIEMCQAQVAQPALLNHLCKIKEKQTNNRIQTKTFTYFCAEYFRRTSDWDFLIVEQKRYG